MRQIYKLLMIILLILIAIIGIIGLNGCSSQSKLNRAKQRVLINADARHEVFLNELERFPCSNDSTIQFIQAQIDSVSLEDYVNARIKAFDFTYIKKDTLPDLMGFYYKKGFQDAANQYSKIKIPICKPEYIKVTVTDRQKEKILTDSLQARNLTVARLYGATTAKDQATQEWKAQAQKNESKWLWWLIASIVFGIISNLGWIYFKFKP